MSLLIRLKPLFFKKKILFLIAHPDDEVMFFGPTILRLVKDNEIFLVCLSNGNAEGIGKVREKELLKSCQILGISEQNIEIIENSNLQDSMSLDWNPALISGILSNIVIKRGIEIIITFDEFGISRHPNHIACYYGTLVFFNSLETQKPHIYVLPSVFILRKYLSFFDLFFTLAFYLYHLLLGSYFSQLFRVKDKKSYHLSINSLSQFRNVQRAMIGHSSQMKWFRWLYIYTSRYMIFNELERRK